MKKSGKLIALLLVVGLVAAMFAGCAAETETAAVQDEAAASSAVKDPYTDEVKIAYIGALTSTNGNQWGEAVKSELSVYDNITVSVYDSNNDAETENELIAELIVQNYDALILQAADSTAVSSSITRAEKTGMNVITMNIDVDVPHSAHITTPSYQIGVMTANACAEAIGGKGQVAYIDVPTEYSATVLMGQAFKDTMEANYPDIEVVAGQPGDWTAETANQIARDYLVQYPDLKAIYAGGDVAAVGVMQAVEAAGKTGQVDIWGCDGEATCLDYISQGLIKGTLYSDYETAGVTAARLALYLIGAGTNGASYEKTPTIYVNGVIVTADNVDTIPMDKRW